MSPHAANSLVHDLVQMAKAMEDLPVVSAELDHCRSELAVKDQYILTLQQRLMDRANEIQSLQSEVSAAKEARDDAEMRFLECDDAKSTLERTLQGLVRDVSGVLEAVKPLQPTVNTTTVVNEAVKLVDGPLAPIAETPSAMPSWLVTADATPAPAAPIESDASGHDVGQSAMDPIVATQPSTTSWATLEASSQTAEPTTVSSPSVASTEGVSVSSDPTPPNAPAADANVTTASSQDGAGTPAEVQPDRGPYYGRRYIDIPGWVSRSDWLAGGGTEYDYDHRLIKTSAV